MTEINTTTNVVYTTKVDAQTLLAATVIPEAIERMADERYKVVPSHESMFHRWAVVAGGTQQLYLGREVECQNMARKFAGAFLDGAFVAMQQRASRGQAPAGATLPDGSAFAVGSFPLPQDHWLYAPHEYEPGADEPKELLAPILTHAQRNEVVAAVRYAVRGATMCGKEPDFDPDALVQNAVYALCGSFGRTALATTAQATPAAVAGPKKWAPEEVEDGERGIRWVTNDGIHGRPTDHDVREYLKRTPTANGCHCDECKVFYAAAHRPPDTTQDGK